MSGSNVKLEAMGVALSAMLLSGCMGQAQKGGTGINVSQAVPQLNVVADETGDDTSSHTPSATNSEQQVQYFDGNGNFIKADPTRIKLEQDISGDVSASFRDMDLRVIAQAIMRDQLGEAVIIDPRVTGRGSLETSGPVSKDVLRLSFEILLKTKGYALVQTTAGNTILPLSEAVRSVSEFRVNSPASAALPGFSVHVVTLAHTRPTEMQKLIEPFSVPGGVLRADDNRNMLILAGTRQELTSMFRAIETFDVDRMAGMSFAIYPLKYVEAEQVVSELNTVFGGATMNSQSTVHFIPVPRINRVIGVAPSKAKLREVEAWIEKLDIGESAPGRRIYVYNVKNGRAVDIASTLNLILDSGYYQGSGRNTAGTARSNRNTVNRSRNVDSRNRNGQRPNSGVGAIGEDYIRIVPSEENNSIVIMATPSEFGVIESALKRIDIPPRQVLVEVTLAEVGLTDELRYGLQWHFEFGDNQVTFGQSSQPSAQLPGFAWTHTASSDASAVLNALESISDVTVISAPKLLVLNNHSATLQIGDEVPVPTSTAVNTTTNNAPIVNTIQYRDTGVILTVTPRINEGGLVMLDVEQEVSTVVETSTSGIDAPTIQQRRMTSTVAVQNGSTIALGGLIRNSISKSDSGVPLLKDIPLLGNAFKSSDIVERRSELVILLTPRIIRNVDETREAMDYLQREFRSLFDQGGSAQKTEDR